MEWIDVRDRLPEPGEMVQVAISDWQGNVTQAVVRAETSDGMFVEPASNQPIYARQLVARGPMVVTHWHPLLENPSEPPLS